jgi:hypothetical protein
MTRSKAETCRSVLLYRAKDMIEASMLIAMLEESGVRAWTVGGQGNIGLGDLPSDCLLVDVRVEEPDHARSIDLVKEFFERPREAADSDDRPWTCGSCGESIEGSFTACWSCGASRTEQQGELATTAAAVAPVKGSSPMNSRWSSWQVKALRTYLLYIGLSLMIVAPSALSELVSESMITALRLIGFTGLLIVGLRWALGLKDVPTDPDLRT